MPQNAHCHPSLVSNYTILFMQITLHMSGCCSKNSEWMHSPTKTMLGKIRDRYQNLLHHIKDAHYGYLPQRCRMPHRQRHWSPVEDAETTSIDNDNESISGLGHYHCLGSTRDIRSPWWAYTSNQAKLTALTREINDLHQWVEARERQSAESLDCIEWELQNLSLVLQTQLSPIPTPTEPLREEIHQNTNTSCTTQKQTNLTNSLLQDTLSLMNMILQSSKTG